MRDHFTATPIAAAAERSGYFDPATLARLPECFRIASIERLPVGTGCLHRVGLFHERASLTVSWIAAHADTTLARHCLVSVRWCSQSFESAGGDVPVARLVRLERPLPTLNLFETVPRSWVPDRKLVRRGRDLWERLPRGFRHVLNGVFWDSHRFERFLTGPSSLRGHHNERNGNFRHSVEVAEQALLNGAPYETTFPPVLILAGLLHDAGKADEYEVDASGRAYGLSERGRLIGHKHTVLEWIAAARARHGVVIPESHYVALIHALTAARGAPEWLGLRPPKSLEASILSKVDRLSGEGDLYRQVAPRRGGFGGSHRHLRHAPYFVGSEEIDEDEGLAHLG